VVMLCIMTFLRLNLSWQTSYSEWDFFMFFLSSSKLWNNALK
jgi:hypothetical protein